MDAISKQRKLEKKKGKGDSVEKRMDTSFGFSNTNDESKMEGVEKGGVEKGKL